MKSIINIVAICTLAVVFFSCEKEEFTDVASAKYEYVGISDNRIANKVFEGSGDNTSKIPVEVLFGNDVKAGRDITVTFEVDNSSTAVLGEDFVIKGANVSGNTFTVTIPSDSYLANFEIETITNFDEADDLNLKINLVDADGVNVGYPLDKSFSFVIEDDDCAFVSDNFTGTASATEIYGPDDTYGPYDAEFTYNGNNNFTMTNFWDWGADVSFNVDPSPEALTITVPNQTILLGGYPSTVEGTGIINTCGTAFLMTVDVMYGGNGNTYSFDAEYTFE
jgi:hypothetical protein